MGERHSEVPRFLGGIGARAAAVVVVAVAAAACSQAPEPAGPGTALSGWHEFEGSWNASGRRHTIALGGERRASLLDLTGSLLLAGAARPAVGFRAEVIGLGDTATGFVGRAVWTDENGDQVFSELHGDGTHTGKRIEGTFVGGTGRYAGASGGYAFTWQYVVDVDDGIVQGRAVGLRGRVRVGDSQAAPAEATKP